MSMMNESRTLCVPGTPIADALGNHIPGPGTCVLEGSHTTASIVGVLNIIETPKDSRKLIGVQSIKPQGIIPTCRTIVTARVTVVNPRMVTCNIICVGPSVLGRTYRGVIKKEDIRSTDKDAVDPYKCYRPGDIILARVMPRTEMHWYHLTTAENDLGVVIARADGGKHGVNMVPLSWSEMQCPKTLVKEPRKVASFSKSKFDLK